MLKYPPWIEALVLVVWTTCYLELGLLFSCPSLSRSPVAMGKHYKSPAKIRRSILRLLEYKQTYLEDCWDTEINTNQETKNLIWKASNLLSLTLKKNIRIVENRAFYNPSFPALPFCEKLKKFQDMWKPDQDNLAFFTCMYEHLKRSSSQCDKFCARLGSPYCGRLTYFLSTNDWPFS